VAIAVWWMPLNKRLECPSCMRTKVKTAVKSAPERNYATQRLDDTDLYLRQARDDAEKSLDRHNGKYQQIACWNEIWNKK
jgi:hypothetical protein